MTRWCAWPRIPRCAIRSYASIEGQYETAAIAQRHGVKMWKGAWLGRDLRQNDREIDAECRMILLALLLPKPQGDD